MSYQAYKTHRAPRPISTKGQGFRGHKVSFPAKVGVFALAMFISNIVVNWLYDNHPMILIFWGIVFAMNIFHLFAESV